MDSAFRVKIERSRTRVRDYDRQVPRYALPRNDLKELELLVARFSINTMPGAVSDYRPQGSWQYLGHIRPRDTTMERFI